MGLEVRRSAHNRQPHVSMHDTCDRCGLKLMWVGFHVCYDASKPEPSLNQIKANKKALDETIMSGPAYAAHVRRSRERELNADRDKKIVERYEQRDIGVAALAAKFKLHKTTILRILHDAGVEMNSHSSRF